ncbi:MAG TPA: hypothetical protein VF187_05820, partial [Gemmatimonadales bacterium]
NNTFVGNVIARNGTAVRKPNGDARNAWAEGGRGNYWGDRSIYDLDGDGIGDRPHLVGDPFAALAAKRPVLEIFAGTPAALALSWAERAFPVFDLPRVEDPAPLVEVPAEVPVDEWEKVLTGGRQTGHERTGHGQKEHDDPAPSAASVIAIAVLILGVGAGGRRIGQVEGR